MMNPETAPMIDQSRVAEREMEILLTISPPVTNNIRYGPGGVRRRHIVT